MKKLSRLPITAAVSGTIVAVVFMITLTATMIQSLGFSERTFEAPSVRLAASLDPAVVARGRELVAARCVSCHGENLGGGKSWNLGTIGTVYAPNISSSSAGVGSSTDAEVARAIRYGVTKSGLALFPLMNDQNLSDQDLVAVISYLRISPPVSAAAPADDWRLIGNVLRAWFIKPTGPGLNHQSVLLRLTLKMQGFTLPQPAS